MTNICGRKERKGERRRERKESEPSASHLWECQLKYPSLIHVLEGTGPHLTTSCIYWVLSAGIVSSGMGKQKHRERELLDAMLGTLYVFRVCWETEYMSQSLGKGKSKSGEMERKEMLCTGESSGGKREGSNWTIVVQRGSVKLMLQTTKSSSFWDR